MLDGDHRIGGWCFGCLFGGSGGTSSSCSILFSFFSLFTRNTRTGIPMFPSATQALLVRDSSQTGLAFPREPFVPPSFRGPAKQASFVDIVSLPSSTLGRRGAYSLGLGPSGQMPSRNVTMGYSRYESWSFGVQISPVRSSRRPHTHTHGHTYPSGPFRESFFCSLSSGKVSRNAPSWPLASRSGWSIPSPSSSPTPSLVSSHEARETKRNSTRAARLK